MSFIKELIQATKNYLKKMMETYKIENYMLRTNTILEENNKYENYNKKEYILTPTERKFYIVLKQIAMEKSLVICPQVSQYEIITTSNYSDFNRISRKSIDFVITEPNMKIKCCIELDDYTHKYHNRIERDKFLDELFNKVNLKLLRFQTSNFYDKEKIENAIMGS